MGDGPSGWLEIKIQIRTLNCASGGPVMMTIRTFESGVSGGAIYKANMTVVQKGGSLSHTFKVPSTTLTSIQAAEESTLSETIAPPAT